MNDTQLPRGRYGPNHPEVIAFIDGLPLVTPTRWAERAGGWTAEALARREIVADHASFMAIKWGFITPFDAAGEKAWEIAYAAVAPFAAISFDADYALGYTRTAASEASLAAQALVIRAFLTREDFLEIFHPMPRAGFDPDNLIETRPN
ncbi:hypothetical protein [Homoserinimonas hongtaonis]|uniref:Uncharacterized protein n=1 Tax=Homoserinimonas hongtaonis TaxID=2079791 RepID=A0A2U1T115_9MICO|nr:hypothetical protein [Salinibacterium hongtaonis]PWB97546.1 hypothetical protein DF220_06675 [Salinibacterium hongtaonis]